MINWKPVSKNPLWLAAIFCFIRCAYLIFQEPSRNALQIVITLVCMCVTFGLAYWEDDNY